MIIVELVAIIFGIRRFVNQTFIWWCMLGCLHRAIKCDTNLDFYVSSTSNYFV